jgi:ribosome-associated protein
VTLNFSKLLTEITFTTSRSSGPGGQNVNKVNSKVTLRWNVQQSTVLTAEQKTDLLEKWGNRLTTAGELLLPASESRSQLQNKELAIKKLQQLVTAALTLRKKRKPTKATKASSEKRLTRKKRDAEKKKWRKGV